MKIGKGINWILILLSCLIAIVLISFMFFFNHKKQDTEVVSTTTEQVSTTSTTATSTTTTSTTTTQDSVTTTEEKLSTQEEQTSARSQKLDEQAILNGDFSTLVGTWRNGLVNSGNIEKKSMGSHGTIEFSIRDGISGYGMSIYPAGLIMPGLDTDLTKNRLIAGQAAPTRLEQVFYKVD